MAEVIYADPVTEDILINEADEIAGGEEAECTCCCDCETGGPTADFTSEQTSADPEGNACCVQFTDTSTPGECGEIVSWLWDFGDENTSTAQNPEHCYTGAGPWTATLAVTDARGCTDVIEHEVVCNCNCAVDAPEADFSYTQTDDSPCCFDFHDESIANPDCGEIVEYLWDFGDGNTSTDQNPSHCYSVLLSGPFDVTLTVTDEMGCSDSVVMSIPCGISRSCCPGEFIPRTITVTLPGFPDVVPCKCDFASGGTFTLDLLNDGSCNYRKIYGVCPPLVGPLGVQVDATVTPTFINVILTFAFSFTGEMVWELNRVSGSCRGTFNVPFKNLTSPSIEPCGAHGWSTGEAGKDATVTT